MQPRLSYLICSVQRSGSTLLCEGLRDTGIAGAPAEYFNPYPPTANYRREFLGVTDDREFLGKVIEKSTTPNGVFGTKVHANQLPILIDAIRLEGRVRITPNTDALAARFPHLRYVRLVRENKIRQAISLYRARESKVWWQFKSTSPVHTQIEAAAEDPVFDFAAIERHRTWIENTEKDWGRFFEQHGIVPLSLTYEELAHDLTGTVRRVLEYLEIPADALSDLAPRTLRQSNAKSDAWEQQFRRIQAGSGADS